MQLLRQDWYYKASVVFFLLFCVQLNLSGQLKITEVMSKNVDFLADSEGDHPDWIELTNYSGQTIYLDRHHLSDDRSNLKMWTFPTGTTIKSFETILVWTNHKKDGVIRSDRINFDLNRRGETIWLSNGQSIVVDSLIVPSLNDNQSYGWVSDSAFSYPFVYSSPRQINKNDQIERSTSFGIKVRSLSNNRDSIWLQGSNTCLNVLYSIDGSKPHLPFNKDLILSAEDKIPSYATLFPTSARYRLPASTPRFHHLRFRCMDSSFVGYTEKQATVLTKKQIFDQHNLRVMLVELEESDLFDAETGIYVKGNDENYSKDGKAWKIEGKWTLYNQGIEDQGTATFEIHGHASRILPQKSLKVTNVYSDKNEIAGIKYKKEEPPENEFLLRSFHSELVRNEYVDYGFRDDVVMNILDKSIQAYPQETEPVIVYINGEYWGVHSLRRSSNEYHISKVEGIPVKDIIIEKGADHVYNLYQRIQYLDPDLPASFRSIEDLFDIDNLVDYVLIQTWFNNKDWPYNNIKTWREKDSEVYRFILFDLDATMKYNRDEIFNYFNRDNVPTGKNKDHYLFFDKLMQFDQFRSLLIERYTKLEQSLLSSHHLEQSLEEFSTLIVEEIDLHIDRWHYPRSTGYWEISRSDIRQFLQLRKIYFENEIMQSTNTIVYPNPTSDSVELGLTAVHFESYRWITPLGRMTNIQPISGKITLPSNSKHGIYWLELIGPFGKHRLPVVREP